MGPCMSMIPGAPVIPKVEVPPVADAVAKQLQALPDAFSAANTKVENGWESAKSEDKNYEVMGGKDDTTVIFVLKKDDPKSKVREAAAALIAKGKFAIEVGEAVWAEVEPQVDSQKPEIPDTPVMTGDQIWAKAKEQAATKVKAQVATQVENAVDEYVRKLNEKDIAENAGAGAAAPAE